MSLSRVNKRGPKQVGLTEDPRPDEKSGSDREVAILDAAARAFMEMGFAAASLDRVADFLDATKGTIYYYYRTKSDLFAAVNRRAMELTAEAIGPFAHAQGDPRERLWQMSFAHTLLIIQRLPYLRVAAQGLELYLSGRMTIDEQKLLKEIAALRAGNEQLYVDVIREGIATGAFRNVEPKLAAKPVLGALNWTSRWYQPRPRETVRQREAIATELATFVCAGLAS
ncbi:TetR/AcrR family transcriptional regulator [Methylobacterium sp. J-030]|uniref:TetR/AcrR family transcriptional regulator n=1 Tax=Methylobacterium sp. J-030 TaxID=2836627 RepID=UPI001FB8628E|nr:TetR/AcrR family transcriptional regulator [Methylobacterium sp. J-030]MCJ2072198.1 TetR/AcrR family transcriptional regulator [Methylobacterium sp. J-030]